ncbi:MAG: HAMP domain-containing histidine kinase [Clostridiales bacterium]|nr:HAMP domain-containing histidine kinase [Clostridiales bacterium]
MLRKLRNQLLLVNVISLSIVVAGALCAIYIAVYYQEQHQIDMRIATIPRDVMQNILLAQQEGGDATVPPTASTGNPTASTGNPAASTGNPAANAGAPAAGANNGAAAVLPATGQPGGMTINGAPSISVDYSKSFVVNIFENNQATVFSHVEIPQAQYQAAIQTVLTRGAAQGKLLLSGRIWQYSLLAHSPTVSAPYNSSIVFLDVNDVQLYLQRLMLSLFIIALCAVGAAVFVSSRVANRAILPAEAGMKRQNRFVADASHELKTPLAVITMNAEAARYSEDPTPWLHNIEDEAARMERLIENLLNLARAEDAHIERVSFDLVQATEEETERASAILFEKGAILAFEAPILPGSENQSEIIVHSDREKLTQILSILMENAVKYTPAGGHVTVRAIRQAAAAEVVVTNTGAYIEPNDRSHIFDRFFRTDRSRNSDTGGHGLGLSIAKELASRLGATIAVTSERIAPPENGGSTAAEADALNTFTLRLPE